MSIRPAISDPGRSNCGSFALVTYLPGPLGSFLTKLRQILPGDNRPEAHITFLPPRPLAVPMEAVSSEIHQTLCSVKPFELELGVVRVFPETNILYLSVEAGHKAILNLHSSLNNGGLFTEEQFEYIPHLTLSGSLAPGEVAPVLDQAERAWNASELPRRFVVNDVVLLWQPGACSDRDWTRVSSFPLQEQVTNDSSSAATRT